MNFEEKIKTHRSKKIDKFVSIGVRCIPSTTMVNTRLKQETFTFDWIQSNPQIVLDCIKDHFKKYNNFNQQTVSDKYDMHIRYGQFYNTDFPKTLINEYGMCFTHYTKYQYDKFTQMCKRRSERFINLLNSQSKVLFVYMNDKDVKLQRKQYRYLLELRDYLHKTYPKLDFTILSLQDIECPDSKDIINLKIIKKRGAFTIQGKKFANNYDSAMKNCFANIFKTHPKYPQQKLFG